jgi:hypothetical protein
MKIFSLILVITFFSSFKPAGSSLINWSAERRLTWDDFKARPDRGSPNAALTGTDIKFDFSYNSNKGFQYHISCWFDKNKSWGRVKTDYILSHEQGHFDIAEIYARKLCKAFREYHPDAEKAQKDVNRIYEKVIRELTETQKRYDHETNFSINKEEQMEWLKKIDDELKSLEPYADYH